MKGQRTDVRAVEKVKHLMATGISQSECAKLCGLSDSTIYGIMRKWLSTEEGKAEYEKLKEEKKKKLQEHTEKEFEKTMKESFERLFNKSVKVIDKAIDEDKISPRDAITVMGTTFDKRQIMTGKSTQNINLNFEDLLEKINEGNEY